MLARVSHLHQAQQSRLQLGRPSSRLDPADKHIRCEVARLRAAYIEFLPERTLSVGLHVTNDTAIATFALSQIESNFDTQLIGLTVVSALLARCAFLIAAADWPPAAGAPPLVIFLRCMRRS